MLLSLSSPRTVYPVIFHLPEILLDKKYLITTIQSLFIKVTWKYSNGIYLLYRVGLDGFTLMADIWPLGHSGLLIDLNVFESLCLTLDDKRLTCKWRTKRMLFLPLYALLSSETQNGAEIAKNHLQTANGIKKGQKSPTWGFQVK